MALLSSTFFNSIFADDVFGHHGAGEGKVLPALQQFFGTRFSIARPAISCWRATTLRETGLFAVAVIVCGASCATRFVLEVGMIAVGVETAETSSAGKCDNVVGAAGGSNSARGRSPWARCRR